MTRFIHTADWQLGMTRRFLSTEEQARYSQAQLDAIGRIAALARSEACQFVVVSGDVFDSNHLDRKVLARALEAMSAFDVPVYLLPGNHDPASAASVYISKTFTERCPPNVSVLKADEPIAVPGSDAEVIGAPWDSKRPLEDLVARACSRLQAGGGRVRIMVGHGGVDASSPDRSDPALIGLEAAEEAIGLGLVQYLALGDRHSATDVGSTGRIWYSGAPLMTDYTETDPNNVLLVDVDREQIAVERRQVGDWAFIKHTFNLSSREDVDGAAAWLQALENKHNTIVKLSFVGTLNLSEKAHLDEQLEHAGDLFAALDVWERRTDLAVLPDDSDLQSLGLSGFAAEVLEELRERSQHTSEDGQVAQDALGLLYRLAGGGR
ncbi:MAG: DNA repair exonuclease [Solirubrobacteraceae bacterium]